MLVLAHDVVRLESHDGAGDDDDAGDEVHEELGVGDHARGVADDEVDLEQAAALGSLV